MKEIRIFAQYSNLFLCVEWSDNMFFDYLKSELGVGIYDRIMIYDKNNIISAEHISLLESNFGYNIVFYQDVEEFRYLFESEIKKNNEKYFILLCSDMYVPYDVRQEFCFREVSYGSLFNKLNPYVLNNYNIFDVELLYIAHENLYRNISSEVDTRKFLEEDMYLDDNVEKYLDYLRMEISQQLAGGENYTTWLKVGLLFAKYEYIQHKTNYRVEDVEYIETLQEKFKDYILRNYKSLSSVSAYNSPVLLSRVLDHIFMQSSKPALIVMDGMSIEDWLILTENLKKIKYELTSSFAIIPTITAISRQSMLSGELPVLLKSPFNLNNEENLFIEKCKENGYKDYEINYYRGYDFEINDMDRCICVIINDIDDLIHSQRQGNIGMYRDVQLLSRSGNLCKIITRLFNKGFDVYITSDHGHKECNTIGTPKGSGVEVQTKSKRVLILKDFGDYEKPKKELNLIEYLPYYLPKEYTYLICQHNEAIGLKGQQVISHGGISLEEVIVPFIKVKGVEI